MKQRQFTMKKDDNLYLIHILDATVKIESYLQGVNKEVYDSNTMIQDAIIRQLEVIGEATKNISNEMRDSKPNIPWQDMAGMRDKLIHHYFGVDIGQVWLTANTDIPPLKNEIQSLLDSLG